MTTTTIDHRPRPPRPRRPARHVDPPAAPARDGARRRAPAAGLGAARARSACSPPPRVLYLWGLGASGWANAFYSAAVQAGSQSWKAFFFGSSDAAQLHHGRQAAGVAVGHGPVGAGLRRSAPGASSCRRR